MPGRNIVLLGAGNIGGTLGRKWAAAGHKVTFGVPDPSSPRAQALRAELGDNAAVGTVADALSAGDVVLMAVPGAAMAQTIADNAAQLDGKIVIDAANNLSSGSPNSYAVFQARTPRARVFRAFNTLGWENFANPVIGGVQADLLYCGPGGDDGAVIEQLIRDIGLRPIRVGDMGAVGMVDSLLPLWFALSQQGHGRHMAFKVLTD